MSDYVSNTFLRCFLGFSVFSLIFCLYCSSATALAEVTPKKGAQDSAQNAPLNQAKVTLNLTDKLAGPAYYQYAKAKISVSIEASIVKAVGPEPGIELTQVVKRLLVWWLQPRKHTRKDDILEVVYSLPKDATEPVVHAVWFKSGYLKKQKTVVRYKPKNSTYHRYIDEEGYYIERQLKNAPLKDYEQVTSLIGDGRGHNGMDFKAPIGTPIYAPFNGRVVRRNWSTRYNGNCIEFEGPRGLRFYFLHLNKIAPGIRAGRRVRKQHLLGYVGNTGRSSAPHLHYQIEKRGRVLDPLKIHKTYRVRLSEQGRAVAKAKLKQYGKLRKRGD